MKLLLKLKHWQLFSLTWKVPILITVFTINDVEFGDFGDSGSSPLLVVE